MQVNKLLANIVHINLNARGGSERLAVATMKALSCYREPISFDLTIGQKPVLAELEKSYGPNLVSILKRVRKIKKLDLMADICSKTDYDLTINTHGDLLPYFPAQNIHRCYSKDNYITYCHFPLAQYFIQTKDRSYSALLRKVSSFPNLNTNENFLLQLLESYKNMIKNSTVLTNSKYSRDVIQKIFDIDAKIVYPPVDIEVFRNKVLFQSRLRALCPKSKDLIIVISRFNPTKKIENAIKVARLLKAQGIGSGMKIVGNLTKEGFAYFSYLKEMVKKYGLKDYVTFEVNVEFKRLLSLMRKSKVYFHTLPGEPFGISTVEAMSAGLIPVVPDLGGHTEFVPKKYHFHTFQDAVYRVSAGLGAPFSERISLSNAVMRFSVGNYIAQFQRVVEDTVSSGVSKINSGKMTMGLETVKFQEEN
jgi:glycosyltransferase involved in cell wall biosynthesis